jgi:hypothetical protein
MTLIRRTCAPHATHPSTKAQKKCQACKESEVTCGIAYSVRYRQRSSLRRAGSDQGRLDHSGRDPQPSFGNEVRVQIIFEKYGLNSDVLVSRRFVNYAVECCLCAGLCSIQIF